MALMNGKKQQQINVHIYLLYKAKSTKMQNAIKYKQQWNESTFKKQYIKSTHWKLKKKNRKIILILNY